MKLKVVLPLSYKDLHSVYLFFRGTQKRYLITICLECWAMNTNISSFSNGSSLLGHLKCLLPHLEILYV